MILMKMIAVKAHKVYSRKIRVGETYEVGPRDATMLKKMGWAAEAGPNTPEPIMSRGTYARRDMRATGSVEMVAQPRAVLLTGLTRAKLVELAEAEGVAYLPRDTKDAIISKIEEARRAR